MIVLKNSPPKECFKLTTKMFTKEIQNLNANSAKYNLTLIRNLCSMLPLF